MYLLYMPTCAPTFWPHTCLLPMHMHYMPEPATCASAVAAAFVSCGVPGWRFLRAERPSMARCGLPGGAHQDGNMVLLSLLIRATVSQAFIIFGGGTFAALPS